jgi:alkylated DNA repair dioxygenase AlkB
VEAFNGTPIVYIPNYISEPDQLFQTLWAEEQWVRHDKVPRRECYHNLVEASYTYGVKDFARTYEPAPWHPKVLEMREKLHADGHGPYEVCFLNGYEDGSDQLGYHADDSPEMDDTRSIAIISLGAEREIWFKRRPELVDEAMKADPAFKLRGDVMDATELAALRLRYSEPYKLRLGHGSLCLMLPGMQDTHFHRIPKSDRHNCGPRISLTWRGYVQP